MQEKLCSHCGGSEVHAKEIEIRHIDSYTMALASKQKVTELECVGCGWVASMDMAPAFL